MKLSTNHIKLSLRNPAGAGKKLPAINTALITLIAVIGVLLCSTGNGFAANNHRLNDF